MKVPWIGTGWKMHKTLAEAESYAKELKTYIDKWDAQTATIFIIPPFTLLHQICAILEKTNILVGSQNMHWEPEGAFTGEISPIMIKDSGASLVELGHSERRSYFGETDFFVNKKILSALHHDLRPLVCIGEKMNEKDLDTTKKIISAQIKISLQDVEPSQMEKLILAYEPVWAIGAGGVPADPTYANAVHELIRELLSLLYSRQIAESVPILYGGSVNHSNALEFLKQPNIDGLFIGRAALEVTSFIQFLEMVKSETRS